MIARFRRLASVQLSSLPCYRRLVRKKTFPIPLHYVDVMRQTTTQVDNVSESTASDFLTEAKDVTLFEEWMGTTRLQILRTRHPEGYT